jgi:hypothetical protein
MDDRLAHALVLEHREGRAVLRVHLQEDNAHRLAADDLKIWHGSDLVGLVLRHMHDEVEPAGQQLRHLGLPVRDEARLDLGDLRLALGRVLEVVGVALQRDRLADGVL